MNTEPDNLLAVLRDAWTHCPRRLISLRDMIQASGRPFIFLTILEGRKQLALKATRELGPGKNADCEVTRELEKQLEEFRKFCEAVDIRAAADHVVRLWIRLGDTRLTGEPITNEAIAAQIDDLQAAFWFEMAKRNFIFIPQKMEGYFERDSLFGQEVESAFQKATKDIRDAGNCLALDLNTAAVFHLMRVAEFGLRAFAKKLGVAISDEDLPYQEWHDVLTAIRKAVNSIAEAPPGSRKDKAEVRECYNGIMQEIEGFKDVWRNSVMHTRGSYNAAEAEGVFLRVRDFMQRLAKLLLQD